MPQYSSGGQFGGSPYNNPQMQGWNNQNSQQNQWQQGWSPDAASWSQGAPGHQGQNLSYNPQTGEQSWLNSTEGLRFGNTNSGPGGAVGQAWYIDPNTGMKTINMKYIMDMMGGMGGGSKGGGGYQNYTPTEGPGGQVTPGQGYGGFDYSAIGSGIDPSAVIAAQEYKLNEAMQGDFSKAGGRMGQSGYAMSTPYANALGDASRKASQDRNAITLQYQYDAAQQQAQREVIALRSCDALREASPRALA